MGRIFYRQYPRAFWEPLEWEGPLKDISLREWEIAVILCSQHREIDQALRRWLETPTDHQRWPWSNDFPRPRALFAVGELGQPVDALLGLFHDEIKTIRQTLDFPIEVFSGINRNALLAAHGQRLRWLVRRLGLRRALAEIAQLTAPAQQAGKEKATPSAPASRLGWQKKAS
ncbi:MAG TPA: hypothetical protein VKT82_26750 [Ktedonobacterales bacterium]|nr:hypothetical protein [Ktedonobacterales bacterium]